MGRGGRSHLAQRLGALVGLESPLDPSPVLDYLESPAPSAAGITRLGHSHDLVNARAEHHPPLRGSMITVARLMGNLVVQHRTDLSHARGPCRAEAHSASRVAMMKAALAAVGRLVRGLSTRLAVRQCLANRLNIMYGLILSICHSPAAGRGRSRCAERERPRRRGAWKPRQGWFKLCKTLYCVVLFDRAH